MVEARAVLFPGCPHPSPLPAITKQDAGKWEAHYCASLDSQDGPEGGGWVLSRTHRAVAPGPRRDGWSVLGKTWGHLKTRLP